MQRRTLLGLGLAGAAAVIAGGVTGNAFSADLARARAQHVLEGADLGAEE
jgi:hypothetical protein